MQIVCETHMHAKHAKSMACPPENFEKLYTPSEIESGSILVIYDSCI